MGNKLGFLAGLGAGAYLALKLNPQQAAKVRDIANSVKESAPVRLAGQTASDTVGKTIRKQGAAFTDHVAQQIKTKLFGQDASDKATSGPLWDSDVVPVKDAGQTTDHNADQKTGQNPENPGNPGNKNS